MKASYPIFTMGPWHASDGNPDRPQSVHGILVTEVICARPNQAVALVRLADRRYALTGPTVIVGPARKLDRYLRLRGADSLTGAWYEQARAALGGGRSSDPT